jgi:hypothetical protein
VKSFLSLKKTLLTGAGIAVIALAVPGVASVAQAGTPPADQVVLDGSCLSLGDVLSAAQAAIAAYVPGGPPAGVTVNNMWVPAVFLLTNAGQFTEVLGLCNQAPAANNSPTTDPPTTDPPSIDPPTTDPPSIDPPSTDPNGSSPCDGHHHGWGQGNGGQGNGDHGNGGQGWGQGNGGQGNGGQGWGQGNGGQGNGGQGNGGQGNGGQPS